MKKVKKRSDCPISSALDIFGDKWSLLIIRDIAFSNKTGYGDFLRSDEKIATNILADRLSILEWAGIISKSDHPDKKSKFVYQLTQKGIDLIPTLCEIILWSDKYHEISPEARMFAKQIRKNRDETVRFLQAELKKRIA